MAESDGVGGRREVGGKSAMVVGGIDAPENTGGMNRIASED